HNPYWDTWGVTLQDPDGYLLVLSTRTWPST
ncbi:VOC family protein, partial [Streptomyces caelestis]